VREGVIMINKYLRNKMKAEVNQETVAEKLIAVNRI
jgi:hypothetical protein